jgi:serine protease Do
MKKKVTLFTSVLVIAVLLASCAPAVNQTATTVAPAASATQAPVVNNITTNADQDAYVQIYKKVNPSVVNIRVVETLSSTQQDSSFQFPDFPGFPDLNDQQQQQQVPTQVEGSGFVYDTDGHIVTNNHVVENADRIVVTFSDGTEVEAKVVGTDPGSDLAVIQVDVNKSLLTPVPLADSDQLNVGQIVVAIGSPFGLQGSMTTGIISSLGRTLEASSTTSSDGTSYSIPDIIQTDAAINPGNSGGPLLNLSGEVIGVNTAIESSTNSSAGVGYAIPSAIVKQIATTLINSGSVEHTYLGISYLSMSSDLATAMDLPVETRGVLIEKVSSTSPAGKAGLKASSKEVTIDGVQVSVGGDVITKIDGNEIKVSDDLLSYLLAHTTVGQTVTLEVIRDGKTITVPVTLEARPTL